MKKALVKLVGKVTLPKYVKPPAAALKLIETLEDCISYLEDVLNDAASDLKKVKDGTKSWQIHLQNVSYHISCTSGIAASMETEVQEIRDHYKRLKDKNRVSKSCP